MTEVKGEIERDRHRKKRETEKLLCKKKKKRKDFSAIVSYNNICTK